MKLQTALRATTAAAAIAAAASSAATEPALDALPAAPIESCVSRDAIALRYGQPRALLDAADRRRVQAAALSRWPVLQRDGVEPSHIVLWNRGRDEWLYVALLAEPRRAGGLCFTATYTARGFDFTGALLRKYFHVAI